MKFAHKIRSLVAVLAMGAALLLAGCLQVETIVQLRPDGSGTIIQSSVSVKQMRQSAEENERDPGENILAAAHENAAEYAADFGEGVKVVSVEKLKTDVGTGAKIVFSFEDVTKLTLQQVCVLRFKFTKGHPARLVVTRMADPKVPGAFPPGNEPNKRELYEAGETMRGGRDTIIFEVIGEITKTDASFRDGAKITYLDLPDSELRKDPAVFKAWLKASVDWPERLKLLKGLPGVKAEMKEAVTIEFK